MATTEILTPEESSYMPAGMPGPARVPRGLDAEFWDGTKRHEIMIQHCKDCDTLQFGPEWICHNCHSYELDWKKVSSRGRIYSWERAWHHVHPALKGHGPYLAVLIELEDTGGIRLVGNLLGDPMQDVVIGTEVEAVFEDHEGGETLIQWRVV